MTSTQQQIRNVNKSLALQQQILRQKKVLRWFPPADLALCRCFGLMAAEQRDHQDIDLAPLSVWWLPLGRSDTDHESGFLSERGQSLFLRCVLLFHYVKEKKKRVLIVMIERAKKVEEKKTIENESLSGGSHHKKRRTDPPASEPKSDLFRIKLYNWRSS